MTETSDQEICLRCPVGLIADYDAEGDDRVVFSREL
jgi:hypothetical protein